MYKLSVLTFVICCAVVLAAVSAYPSYPVAGDYVGPYKAEVASPEQQRVTREAAADRRRGGNGRGRGRGRGNGYGRYRPNGGQGGFGRLGGQGFGGSNAGSQANSASFSQSFSSPFGTFSASGSQSSSNSFANSGFQGRR